MDTQTEVKTEIDLIKEGIYWLTKFKSYRNGVNGDIQPAVKYGEVYAKLISRFRNYLEREGVDKEEVKKTLGEIDDLERNLELKEILLKRFFSEIPVDKQLARIEELFIQLKKANDWIVKHEDHTDEIEALINRAALIIDELEGLGVTRTFSCALLIMGARIDWELSEQFKK